MPGARAAMPAAKPGSTVRHVITLSSLCWPTPGDKLYTSPAAADSDLGMAV